MSRLIRSAVALGGTALVVASVLTAGSAGAEPVVASDPQPNISTNLSLVNGWTNYGNGTRPAAVSKLTGIVQLRGAISTTGTAGVAFVLPPTYRPTANVYVSVDLCNATKGRLLIQSDGTVTVQAAVWSNAQCFTSLESVTYPFVTSGYQAITPINGWSASPFGTRSPGVKIVNGVVNYKGALSTEGTNASPFVVPAGFRPDHTVFVAVDMCGATNGRMIIDPSGTVTVQAETDFSNAACFTSLEGVTYALTNKSYTALSTINSWAPAAFGTRPPAARSINGYIHLQGAISTAGSSINPFNLPPAFRPIATLYVPVDMCGATNGRLVIATNGVVQLMAESDFSNAACFTSLEGVVYRRT